MAFAVALLPAPAITGTRPRTALTTVSTTAAYSSTESVGASPVVPQGLMASVPLAIWNSTKFFKAA
jgi:hypothetical protein